MERQMPVIPPALADLFRLEHPIAAPVELVLRKIPTVLSEAKRSSSHSPHRGRNSTFRDSMSVPQLVFLPRAAIAGNAAIFSPRWTMNAS
jgi:hypothetical protein